MFWREPEPPRAGKCLWREACNSDRNRGWGRELEAIYRWLLPRPNIKIYISACRLFASLPCKWSDNNSIYVMTNLRHSITNTTFSSQAKSIDREIDECRRVCRKYVLEQLKINRALIELDNSIRIYTPRKLIRMLRCVALFCVLWAVDSQRVRGEMVKYCNRANINRTHTHTHLHIL